MKVAPRALLLSAFLTALAVTASAAPPPASVPVSTATIVVPITARATQPIDGDTKALAAELAQRSDAAKREVFALQRRHDATAFAPLRDAFQQRIEAVKREAQLDQLAIRLRHAQASGHADDARALAAALDAQRKLPVPALRALPAEPVVAPIAPAVPVRVQKEAGR